MTGRVVLAAPKRELAIKVDPRPSLTVGDKVKFADTKRRWTVRGVTRRGRFVILTQPFNPRRTVLYTVVDFDRGVRGRDDHYGLGYESDEQVAAALHFFQHTEDEDPGIGQHTVVRCDDAFCVGGADVSYRSGGHIRLDFEAINDAPVDRFGASA